MNTTIRKINLEASSVEDAIRRVAAELNVPESILQAKILSEEKGFFGLFGRKLRLEITVNPKPAEDAANAEKEVKIDIDQQKAAEPSNSVSRNNAESDNQVEAGYSAEPENIDDEARKKLINESQIFLNELMEKMDMNIVPNVAGNFISLDGEDTAIVVGRYGDTLKAIEYLLNLCIRETKDVPRIRLDSDGYRVRREANLQRLAASAAKKAAERGIPIRLEPMASWERRIVHMALQNNPDVVTESIGESPDRKVVVMPKVNHNEVRTRPRRRLRR